MSKLRSVSTAFWSDPFIEDLTPNQKLLFLYLITNDKTNMLGIYELSVRKMSFETGIKKDEIEKGLKVFESLSKVKYIGNYVILVNYMKHQNFNTNMKKSAIDIYNSLPNVLKDTEVKVSKSNPLEGFETLLKHYGMVPKDEVETELEDEGEGEGEEEPETPNTGVVFPFDSEKFKKQWDLWKDYKLKEFRFKYKTPQSEQAALIKLAELANKNEDQAILIINESFANGWKGFFKTQNNGSEQKQSVKPTDDELANALREAGFNNG